MQEVTGSTPVFSTKRSLSKGPFFMYFVYILYSVKLDRYYIGQTDDLEKRIKSHELGLSKYTSVADDWKKVYSKQFETRTEALKREQQIKRKKSRIYIEWLIKNWEQD
jgi:putative endonuclease